MSDRQALVVRFRVLLHFIAEGILTLDLIGIDWIATYPEKLIILGSKMIKWLRRLSLEQKVRASIPSSNLVQLSIVVDQTDIIQAYKVYFHCL